MGERLTLRVREMMFAAILRNEVGWFDDNNNNSGLVSSRLASDATLVRGLVVDRGSILLQTLLLLILFTGNTVAVFFGRPLRARMVACRVKDRWCGGLQIAGALEISLFAAKKSLQMGRWEIDGIYVINMLDRSSASVILWSRMY